ncbi:ABC transporter permease [Pseudooceanicola sp. CBS1P-1]|uniref:ABC transporter permease subunit n=1 Tax=Pseudooceanicola albus TaxID=2692189 RepID=A0A6L7GBM6_9RHOB|nr:MULTISPECIES: ABC transporter permease [Pseudooceanicola]MBT9386759.1 ABC transporter permease [Pseudooceanicola endophyticus]MXN20977.1 ABC transporter permease subunit [Pseudooceanicola albus]
MAKLVLPAGLLVLALLGVPMLLMLRYSFNSFDPLYLMKEAFTFGNYARAVVDPYYQKILLTTVAVALASTLLTTLLAYGPAYWLARMEGRWKSKLTILTMFPLLVGGVVRSAGYMALLSSDGLINATLRGLGLITVPLQLLYTPGAVVFATVGIVLPYMILTLASVIESIPRQVEDAAANLGARPGTAFIRVLMPLSLPGVLAGSTLVFILCMNAYATPLLLGGPQFQMMAPAVYDQFARASNWPFGAALAFLLLVVTVALTTLGSSVIARRYKAG